MYDHKTGDILVSVEPQYLDDQSTPEDGHFVWAYSVKIENHGDETVQLLNRYWRITDGFGSTREVRGTGVVGEQPFLKPGQTYEYTSGAPLTTPSGIMVGSYEMQDDAGRVFDVAIPAFSLDSPHDSGRVN
jgi:ApaG protein